MSHFQVGKKQYSACVPGPGDHHNHDTDKADPDELHMVRTVEEAIKPHREFQHEFDYGDTTYLNLEHAGVVPVPYECVAELANEPWNTDKYSDHFITIVARNKPVERCFTCGQTASLRYYKNPYILVPREMDGPIVAPPYFCSDCSPQDEPMVTLRELTTRRQRLLRQHPRHAELQHSTADDDLKELHLHGKAKRPRHSQAPWKTSTRASSNTACSHVAASNRPNQSVFQ